MAQRLDSPAGISHNARSRIASTMSQFRITDTCPYLNCTDVIIYAQLTKARHVQFHAARTKDSTELTFYSNFPLLIHYFSCTKLSQIILNALFHALLIIS